MGVVGVAEFLCGVIRLLWFVCWAFAHPCRFCGRCRSVAGAEPVRPGDLDWRGPATAGGMGPEFLRSQVSQVRGRNQARRPNHVATTLDEGTTQLERGAGKAQASNRYGAGFQCAAVVSASSRALRRRLEEGDPLRRQVHLCQKRPCPEAGPDLVVHAPAPAALGADLAAEMQEEEWKAPMRHAGALVGDVAGAANLFAFGALLGGCPRSRRKRRCCRLRPQAA